MMVLIAVCLLGAMPLVASGMDVSACGQVVPRGEVGNLRANLVCGGPGGFAVYLHRKVTLNLNGFTIQGPGRGAGRAAAAGAGVECAARGCTVNGPGAIVGFGAGMSGTGHVVVTGIGLHGNDVGFTTKGGTVTMSGVVATENGVGIEIFGGRLRARVVEISRNRVTGIYASGARTRLTSLVALENGTLGGVYVVSPPGGRVRIQDSTILGNDGLGEGYDVITSGRLKLVDTVCGRGARIRESRTSPKIRTVIGRLGCRDD